MMDGDWAGRRVLVTGGAGFIGSALTWALNRRGCDRVVIADFLGETDQWRNLAPLRFEDYLEADDLLPRLDAGVVGRFDLVVHLGAAPSTTQRDMRALVRNNYEFSKSLCQRALAGGARFVYASSAATYGSGEWGMSDRGSVRDLERLRPLNAYGYSKHLFDLWCARAGILDRVVGLKFFNVFGPNEGHKAEMRSMVHRAFGQVRAGGPVRLFRSYHPNYADGAQVRDFVYVKDVADVTLHLAAHSTAAGIFNVGSGVPHTWLDLAHAVFAALGEEPRIEFVDMPEPIRQHYQYYTVADVSRLRETGYARPLHTLQDAVADYVHNYLVPDLHLGDEPLPSTPGAGGPRV